MTQEELAWQTRKTATVALRQVAIEPETSRSAPSSVRLFER